MSCSFGCLRVSKMDSKMRPAVPTVAKAMVRPERTFSVRVVFGTSLPLCRSQRSERKEMSRKTVVTLQPAMKRGFSF